MNRTADQCTVWSGTDRCQLPYGHGDNHRYALASKTVTEQMHDMLHADQSGLVAGLEEVLKALKGWAWVRDSRGPYEWDDDRYREEFTAFWRAVDKAASEALDRWKLWKRPCCKLTQSSDETRDDLVQDVIRKARQWRAVVDPWNGHPKVLGLCAAIDALDSASEKANETCLCPSSGWSAGCPVHRDNPAPRHTVKTSDELARFAAEQRPLSPDERAAARATPYLGEKTNEDVLDSRDFYELMQAYRTYPVDAAKPFEAVKAWIRQQFPRNGQ